MTTHNNSSRPPAAEAAAASDPALEPVGEALHLTRNWRGVQPAYQVETSYQAAFTWNGG